MPLINFSGLASGIDSEALINATSEATRQQRVVPYEENIEELEDENSALTELKTLLTDFQTLAEDFSTIAGGGVTKEATSSDETAVTATASKSATNGSYGITVTQLATNATYSFESSIGPYTSSTDAIAPAISDTGNSNVVIDIGTAPEDSVTIAIDATTTLSDFVSDFNNSTTLASATIVNVKTGGSDDYRIVITTANEGQEKGSISVNIGSDITTAGAFDAIGAGDINQAQDAQFSIDGIDGALTRSSNTVNDVIPGVSFRLEAAGSTTITIGDDVASTVAEVQALVEAYNDIVTFIEENNLIIREENGEDVENIFGPLASTRVDDNVLSSIRSDISSSTYDSGTAIKIFADLGITTERDGTLQFNSSELEDAIEDEPNSVSKILRNFADQVALTGGTIDQFTRFNGLFDTTIQSNTELISDLNDRIATAEESIARTEEIMRQRFARLEALISDLQSQQSALTSALAGLGTG